MTASLDAGFADSVGDSQRCFRAVLDAMSHPGRVARIAGVTPASPVCAAAGAVLLTLADHETPLWLDPDASAARGWIAFHCGAPFVADPAACTLAFSMRPPDLARFPGGTHEEPETSATIICQVTDFDSGTHLRLSGPGLREPASLRVKGLPEGFVTAWRGNHEQFPRGVDLILCAGDRVTALPRSVSIEKV